MRHTRFRAGDGGPRTWAGTATRDVEPIGVVDLFLRRRFRALVGQHGSKPERLVGGFVGFLVEELPQAGVVGIFLVGNFDRFALLGEVIVGLRDIHRAYMSDGLLGGAQHGGALLHQLLRKLGGRSFELFPAERQN